MHVESITKGTGYFGKIPTAGDFIRHNLTRAFVEPWDDWLQNAINTSRQNLGEGWLDTYLTSPIYRFVLTPGICGETGWQGVLMPSVDRVGRYFPMTLCKPIAPGFNPYPVLLGDNPWLDSAEQLVLSILQNSLSTEALMQEVQRLDMSLPDEPLTDSPLMRNPAVNQTDTIAIREPLEKVDQQGYVSLLNTLLNETLYAFSVWSTRGSDSVAPSLLTTQGLPPLNAVSAMLDGRWQQWNWQDGHTELSVDHLIDGDHTDPWDR